MTAKHGGVAKLWLLNLIGNAALLAAIYFWLLLPDAHGWQVAGSGVLAIIIIFFGLWLRTGTFAYFRVAEFRDHATVWRAFRHALRHMIALALWGILFAAIAWSLISLRKYAPQFGVWFWQKSPSFLRFGSPRQVFHAAAGLPLKRMARSLRVLKRAIYWLWFCALMLIGGYVPFKLVRWVPELSDLRKQAWSMGLRFFVAYVTLITAFVALLLVVSSHVEKEDSEPIT